MFRLLKKIPYTTERFLKLDRFYRLTLQYDGSVSRLIQNLSGETPKVDLLHSRTDQAEVLSAETLRGELELKGQAVVRYTELAIPKLETLLFARSYWSKKAYDSLIAQNPKKPIGLTLIERQVEQFRQVNWIGESEVELENKFKLMGLTRSYSIKSGGEVICEVEEFFTPKFFLMFNNK